MTKLAKYEGREVVQTTLRVTNAGDGLSEGLSIDPEEYHLGDTVYVVLATECVRIAHEDVKDTDVLKRVHTLRATEGTVVDKALVADVLAEQRDAIARAKGIETLPFDGEDD